MRDELGLKKTGGKMEEKFSAHNVDSWVLAHSAVGGKDRPDNEAVWRLIPLRFHRRQLHRLQPSGGVRKAYGGTMSNGIKRGSLVRRGKHLFFVGGGTDGKGVSLHDVGDGSRICRNIKPANLKVLRYGSWRYRNAA